MNHPTWHTAGAAGPAESLRMRLLVGTVVFVLCFAGYVVTLAPGTIFGDPSEYQFIPAIWGIAHPPGYAVYTLVAGLWQRLLAIGTVAYRTNLLAAALGAWTASRVALTVMTVLGRLRGPGHGGVTTAIAVVAGLSVGYGPDVWQHSIHANAHIMSAAITATQFWVLVRWWADGRDGLLYLLAFLVGLGVVHHPITVWGIPAYLVFIVISRPRIVVAWRTILLGILFTGLGMLPWLYFPLRSPDVPFGPTDMATWDGFLRHATAQGLRVNLFHFGLLDQPDRFLVFGSLLRLQYGWLLLALALVGIVSLLVDAPRLGLLWLAYVGGHLAFTLNSVQDVMAYLLHPFVAFGLPIAVGTMAITRIRLRGVSHTRMTRVALMALVVVVGARLGWHLPRISLRDWRDADTFVSTLSQAFDGQAQEATFVSDWEHLTPYFYHTYVAGLAVAPQDLNYVYVTGATPWVESVFGSLASGPTYLTNYRRDVRDLGLRLRPALGGQLWQVLTPPAMAPASPDHVVADGLVDGRLEVLGYDLPTTEAAPGDVLAVTIYARVVTTETEILMPMARLGDVAQPWTTDSRRLTPDWLPGETIVEQYHLYVPFELSPGDYPVTLSYRNLSRAGAPLHFSGGRASIELGTVRVTSATRSPAVSPRVGHVLTNAGNVVALDAVRARSGLASRTGLWQRPLTVTPGRSLHLALRWRVLSRPPASYTIFIHLIDAEGRLLYGHDYTPLGGAFPSYLWFPKWLPGQSVVDPYRLQLPADLAPGTYWLEVGMYEMGSIRRVPQLARDGTMTGDRLILGPVVVNN